MSLALKKPGRSDHWAQAWLDLTPAAATLASAADLSKSRFVSMYGLWIDRFCIKILRFRGGRG